MSAVTLEQIKKETKDPLIIGYLMRVLQERKFQKDPVRFVEEWQKKRGTSEILKIPEDRALEILTKLVQ